MSDKTITISLRGLRTFKVGTMTVDGEEYPFALLLAFAEAPDLKGQIPTFGDLFDACDATARHLEGKR